MMTKSKLELNRLTDAEVLALCSRIIASMTGNGRFPEPNPSMGTLAGLSEAMEQLVAERDTLLQQAQTLTLQIRAARSTLESGLNTESAYVDAMVEKLPDEQKAAAITSAGMAITSAPTPVGPMPRVEMLTATAGDADGTVDLSWNAIRRGLQNFLVELTEDPTGQTGWRFALNTRKSSVTCTGLRSGQRYWFRVTAEGAAGPGLASQPATKVAP